MSQLLLLVSCGIPQWPALARGCGVVGLWGCGVVGLWGREGMGREGKGWEGKVVVCLLSFL